MPRVIKAHKVGFLFVAIVLGAVVAASCLVDFGREPPTKAKRTFLSFKSDPSGLPVEGLIDDWFFLDQEEDPSAYPREHVKKIVGHRHALGEVDASTFELMAAIDSDQVDPSVYPSLAELDREERTATVVLAVLELTEEFDGDWAEVVRLVYGDAKSVLEVAEALNEANAFPIPDDEIENLPFLDHGLLYELSRAYDKMSGCSSSHCRAEGDTVIDHPVVQWLVAYRAGTRAKHKLGNQGPRQYPWEIETEAELNLLMYLLGDHEPPAAPSLDPVTSPTAQNPITLTGTAEVSSFIDVNGGQAAAEGEADQNGAFSVDVTLNPNQQNVLSVTATDRAGNTGEASEVTVVHDDLPPEVEITAPIDGTLIYINSVDVAGTVSDAAGFSVTVNGMPALVDGSDFSLEDLVVSFGMNLIEAVATDEAGNVGSDLVAVYLPEEGEFPPSGFGVVGPEGGTVTADRPGDPFAGASVEIPPGALDDYTVIVIRAGLNAPPIRDFRPVGPIYEFYPPIEFNILVTVTLPYYEVAIPDGRSEEEIGIYTAEEGSISWTRNEGTVLADENKIVAEVASSSARVAGMSYAYQPTDPCITIAATHEYDCSTTPTMNPTGAWILVEEFSTVNDEDMFSENGELHINTYEDRSGVVFVRMEGSRIPSFLIKRSHKLS